MYNVYRSSNDGKKIDKIKLVDLQRQDNFKNAVTGALLTISNPVTVLAFISVLSYLNFLLHQVAWIDSIFIVIGIFLALLFGGRYFVISH